MTQWKVVLEGAGNNRQMDLAIWCSVSVVEYSRITEVVYTKTAIERIATVPVSVSVMAGDMHMVGLNGQLQLHTLPNVGLTINSQ